MPDVVRRSGVRVSVPEGLVVSAEGAEGGRPVRRGGRRDGAAAATPPDEEEAALVAALREQRFEVVDSVEIAAVPTRQRRRRSVEEVAPGGVVNVAVDLAPDEDAVVLVEEDGEYRWQLPEQPPAASGTRRRRRGADGAARTVTFTVGIAAPMEPTVSARVRRGPIKRLLLGRVKAYVLKFAARAVGDLAMKHLEKDVQAGLVHVNDATDPARWTRLAADAPLPLAGEQPRVLLLVHGTFSSTVGSYGHLAHTAHGRRFLEKALANYDAVVGYDHHTLSEDPRQNATAMLKRLRALGWPAGTSMDAVGFSRGGLVLRSLVEELLPRGGGWRPRVDRAVFVACTNGGTQLAAPDNWHDLVDLYTNLAAAACRGLSLVPGAAPFAVIFGEIIRSVGALVKYLATHAVDDGGVPGLAAMRPDGPFVAGINGAQEGQPTPDDSYYCAITSDFEATLGMADPSRTGIAPRLLTKLGDGFMDRLMGEANDLVVHVDSMTAIDRGSGSFIKEHFDYGQNGVVFHTNYFTQPETAAALTTWLRLGAPGSVVADRRRRGRAAGSRAGAMSSWTTPTVRPGSLVTASASGGASTNFVTVGADTRIGMVQQAVRRRKPDFVVVRRADDGQAMFYAFTAAEVLNPVYRDGPDLPVRRALDLHEHGQSRVAAVADVHGPAERPAGAPGTVGRVVLLDGGRPVGVLPATDELADFVTVGAEPEPEERTAGSPPAAEPQPVPGPVRRRPTRRGGSRPATRPSTNVGFATAGDEDLRELVEEEVQEMLGGYRSASDDLVGFEITLDEPAAPEPAPAPKRRARRSDVQRRPADRTGVGAAPSPVECYFQAEMDDEVTKGRKTRVDVTVSREQIEEAVRAVSDRARVEAVRPDLPLEIQVVPKQNFETATERRGGKTVRDDLREIPVPAPGKVERLTFVVKPTEVGDGEIWVQARQDRLPLVTLKLRTHVVAAGAATRARKTRASVTVADIPAPRQPVDTLRVTEVLNGGQVRYDFDIEFPNAVPRRRLRKLSEPLDTDRETYIAGIYADIEERWSHDAKSFDAFQRDLRSIGTRMFRALVPRDVQQILWENRDAIRHIQVLSTEPFIPWELVFVTDPAKRTPSEDGRFLGEMGLVRWLYEDFPPERLRVRKGKARYVVPEYPIASDVLAATEDEAEILERMFGAKEVEAVADTVYRLLETPSQFDLLHFACHGMADSATIDSARLKMTGAMVDGAYEEDYVYAGTVETDGDLRGKDGSFPLVVLNACQSARAGYSLNGIGGFAQAFVRAGAGAFVGTHWSVGDGAALTFMKQFYESLSRDHETLGEAVAAARKAAREAGDATWLAYVAYGEPYARMESR